MTAPTDAHLHTLAGFLVDRLSAIADLAAKPEPAPPPATAPNPCRLCRRAGTLSLAVLEATEDQPPAVVRVLLCDPHRRRLQATIANPAKYGPTKYQTRTIYALDPEVLK